MTDVGTYRKKPVEVEAMQFVGTEDNVTRLFEWNAHSTDMFVNYKDDVPYTVDIRTLEGIMHAQVNDWVIKGVQGEFYPCKPDIFEATYEKVSDEIVHRDAGTGQFVTEKYAEDNPDTTVKETNG